MKSIFWPAFDIFHRNSNVYPRETFQVYRKLRIQQLEINWNLMNFSEISPLAEECCRYWISFVRIIKQASSERKSPHELKQ